MMIEIKSRIVLTVFSHPASEAPEGHSGALADVTVSGNHRNLDNSNGHSESLIDWERAIMDPELDEFMIKGFSHLSSEHDIGGPLDSVNQGLPAAVEVVELGLGHGVVDVDGGDLQAVLGEHLVQVVHTSGGLLRQALDSLRRTTMTKVPQHFLA